MKKCNHKFESEDGQCIKCKKTLMQLWFDSKNESENSQEIGYCGQFVNEIELK